LHKTPYADERITMKKRMLIALTIAAGITATADSFLDLEFGKGAEDVKASMQDVRFVERTQLDKYVTMESYNGNHKLKGAKETDLIFFNNQLAFINVSFEGTDFLETYSALKDLLEKKYGTFESGKVIFGVTEIKKIIGDIEITLKMEKKMMSNGGTVTMSASSESLAAQWNKALVSDKAAEIGGL
jgi:hypothetical protein